MFKIMRFFMRLFVRLTSRVELIGKENLPPSGNFILAANHLGRMDSVLLLYAIDRDDIIVPVAEKYKNHPLFGPLGRTGNAVWINRFETDFHAMRQLITRMEQGGILVIAPEGTRSTTEALQEAKNGVAYLASKTGYPVIPIALTGTEDRVFKDNLKHFRRSHITARAGKPFKIEIPRGKGREEALHNATDEIMCQIAAMLPPSYRGHYAEHPRVKELLENA
jgi:1-acyl-sn-glycerol-3-phosphate acyltransferase